MREPRKKKAYMLLINQSPKKKAQSPNEPTREVNNCIRQNKNG